MRDKEMLFAFNEITTLCQYLYLSEEHTVEIKNIIGVPLQFSMDDKGVIWKKNLNFPDLPKTQDAFGIPTWLGLIEQLKEQPAKEITNGRFKNRWEEIHTLASTDLSLNRK